jgi:hypothetical protein
MSAVRIEFVDRIKSFSQYESYLETTMIRFVLSRINAPVASRLTSFPWLIGGIKIVDYVHSLHMIWKDFKKMCELKSLIPKSQDLEKFDTDFQATHPNYPFLENSPLRAPSKNSDAWNIFTKLRTEIIKDLFLWKAFDNGGNWCSCTQFQDWYSEKIASLPEGSKEQLKVITEWNTRKVGFEKTARAQCATDCKSESKGLESILRKSHGLGSSTATPQWLIDLAARNKAKREATETKEDDGIEDEREE